MHDPEDTTADCPHCGRAEVPTGGEPDWQSALDDWAWILRLNLTDTTHRHPARSRTSPPSSR
ncbi:hypothetical protein [Actinomadura macra]|uniref:hypothetical protein n=1 Tax=Actinomadura macra TaxID=46164 RepID=UPI00082EED34|nr:hypothetical protein [Actinomadura macra]